jgi:hypothetical protein
MLAVAPYVGVLVVVALGAAAFVFALFTWSALTEGEEGWTAVWLVLTVATLAGVLTLLGVRVHHG